MTQKLSYERYVWLDGQIKADLHPNAATMAARFNISVRQAGRDIEFMKERLNAPLCYDPARRGYAYEAEGWELPPVWLNEEELQALSLAFRLSAAIPDRKIKESLHILIGHFLALRSPAGTPLALEKLEEKVSIKNVGYYRVPEDIFHTVAAALFGDGALRIAYHTPYTGETTERAIRPLHLLCYMGNWHLIAWCGLRKDIRDFAVSRIRTVSPCTDALPLPPDLPPIKEYLRRTFGVIAGEGAIPVELLFSPAIAPLVAQQEWHEAQEASIEPDGGLRLRFCVSGFAEVVREILKYGAEVRVVEPARLRDMVKDEISRMGNLYQ